MPAPVITLSLLARFESRQDESVLGARCIAALRNQFGGHAVKKAEPPWQDRGDPDHSLTRADQPADEPTD